MTRSQVHFLAVHAAQRQQLDRLLAIKLHKKRAGLHAGSTMIMLLVFMRLYTRNNAGVCLFKSSAAFVGAQSLHPLNVAVTFLHH